MSETTPPAAPPAPTLVQKLLAEALGTFVLVFFGCGAAIFSGVNIVSTGLTFGLAVMIMAYSVGRLSGGHFNPAVSLGAALAGRISWAHAGIYMAVQMVTALVAALVLRLLAEGVPGYSAGEVGLGQNAFGSLSSNDYAWWAAFLLEALLTCLFLVVILGVTDGRNEHPALAPLAIGLALSAIHFVAIPLTGTSVNPARSFGPAVATFDFDVILQLWLFILAPLIGAAVAGFLYPLVFGRADEPVPGSGLAFGGAKAPAAVPGYGAPDQFQQQWNQEWPQQTTAPFGQEQGGYQPDPQAQAAPGWTDDEDGRTVIKGAEAAQQPQAQQPQHQAAPADQPVIIQDGWQWDYEAQQWKPAEQPPPQP